MQRAFYITSPEDTATAAKCFAEVLYPGSTVLLQGSVGAGKTHFARSFIQTCLSETGHLEDVPSPTFTLVQTYQALTMEIWHADLYRLSDPDELIELGLETAFETAICLIEWPERFRDFLPKAAITVTLQVTGEYTRLLRLEWDHSKWDIVANVLALMLTEKINHNV